MQTLTFADGTQKEFICETSVKQNRQLFVRVDWNFVECASVFSNQLKTEVMRFDYGDGQVQTYVGYCNMERIEDEGNLRIITMRKS